MASLSTKVKSLSEELMEQHLEASEDVELTRLPFEEELWKKNKESRTSGSARALVNLRVRYFLL